MEKQFKIDETIYSLYTIKKGITDFQEYGDIKILDQYLIISGENNDEIEELFNEFMNYIIALDS